MCVFCQIVAGKISAHKIIETDQVLAFLDIKPVNPGHSLVILKRHCPSIEEASPDELAAVMAVVKQVGGRLKDKLPTVAYNLILNNGPVAGQEIPHLHFHVIPRLPDDNLQLWSHTDYLPGEAEDIIKRLKF